MKRTRQCSFRPDIEAILAEVSAGEGSASQYLAELVIESERDWRSALAQLRRDHTDAEIVELARICGPGRTVQEEPLYAPVAREYWRRNPRFLRELACTTVG